MADSEEKRETPAGNSSDTPQDKTQDTPQDKTQDTPQDTSQGGSGPPDERPPPAYDDSHAPNDLTPAQRAATALLDEKRPEAFDDESYEEKIKYPRSVFFIISNEFCERFSYYGMRTILALYLSSILGYEKDTATVIYHIFTMFCYFFPVFGSMIADSWLGKFRTILYLSVIYAVGNIVISFASAKDSIEIPGRTLSIIGLLLIAMGTGGIKPCVSAFGGDQFILPQQEKQMAQFFSLFYFAINSGSLVSTFLTPVLREDVQCLGQDSCYPLAFGVPAVLMIVSIILFVAGRPLYIVKNPQGNVVLRVCRCMGHAVSQKWKSKGEKRDHWLDYADDKYERKQIEDIKSALRVLFLYIPLPFFWALFDQQGSRWTFQATRMTGKLGGWSLKPDQMQVINPLLILLFIPLFETIIYPVLKKCNLLTRPLQRLGVGGVLAAIAFVISAIVELQLEPDYAKLPSSGEGQVRIYNAMPCDIIEAKISNISITEKIPRLDVLTIEEWPVKGTLEAHIDYDDCSGMARHLPLTVYEKKATSYIIEQSKLVKIEDERVEKTDEAATVSVLYSTDIGTFNLSIGSQSLTKNNTGHGFFQFTPDTYTVQIDDAYHKDITLNIGGVYALLVSKMNSDFESKLTEITPPNKIHMLWLIPQYVVLTMGEVMFSITGLEFSYSQSPLSMKSVMQAGWLLTVAFGNLIVVIIAEAKFFDRQLWEFILFAGLMIVDMGIFALMTMGYKYIKPPNESDEDLALEPTKEKAGIENKNFKADED